MLSNQYFLLSEVNETFGFVSIISGIVLLLKQAEKWMWDFKNNLCYDLHQYVLYINDDANKEYE